MFNVLGMACQPSPHTHPGSSVVQVDPDSNNNNNNNEHKALAYYPVAYFCS